MEKGVEILKAVHANIYANGGKFNCFDEDPNVTANEDEFHEICCEGAEIDEVK